MIDSYQAGQLSGINLIGMQKHIAEVEVRFYKVFSVMQTPACIIDLQDERIINVNYRFVQVFGYSLSELINKKLNEIDLWVDNKQYAEAKAQTLDKGCLREFDSKLKTCQGTVIDARLFVDFIMIKERQCILVQIIDVSSNQNLTCVFGKTQRKLVTLLERMNDGYIMLDHNLHFLYVNYQAEGMIGKPREQLIGKSIATEYPLTTHSAVYKAAVKAKKENIHTSSEDYFPNIRKWTESHFYPSADGITIVFRDITARKKEEAMLKRSREDFKTLVENSLDVIVRYDRQFRRVYINPAIEKLTGLKNESLFGKTWYDLDNFNKEYADNWRKHCNIVFLSGKDVAFEADVPSVFGPRHCHVHAVPEFDQDGDVESVLAIIRDVTERDKMEKEMARLDQLNLVGEMAASIGHEVRNPMTTVRGFLQMLSQKEDLGHYVDFFALMIEELDRANSIITEYLSLAKDKAIDPKLTNINSVIKMVFPLIQADALQMGKNVIYNFNVVPERMLDGKEIRQCILNLVRNGLEAMGPGGTVTITTYVENDDVVLAVKDQGTGIAPEILDKLGTPFLTTKETGTGLGLPVCYSIAKRHNAKISVETGSCGTTFFVKFR
ncbi:Adaptive-response sensory-kinase SasA [bioreactor metagenome]|uniref:Adaptive-response sensory-kinase SasA n=1 Tax=bioreactor metagenome TaxID=1076179 RepID=A0A644SW88_9ZZZZ|nr:PAS domain S-box protein [Negativicutes bacterium]